MGGRLRLPARMARCDSGTRTRAGLDRAWTSASARSAPSRLRRTDLLWSPAATREPLRSWTWIADLAHCSYIVLGGEAGIGSYSMNLQGKRTPYVVLEIAGCLRAFLLARVCHGSRLHEGYACGRQKGCRREEG